MGYRLARVSFVVVRSAAHLPFLFGWRFWLILMLIHGRVHFVCVNFPGGIDVKECKHCENKPLKCFPNTRREAPLAEGGQLPLGAALTAPMQASTFIPGGERLKMPCLGCERWEGAFLSAHAWPFSRVSGEPSLSPFPHESISFLCFHLGNGHRQGGKPEFDIPGNSLD